jgi:hypothetical protein
MSRIGPRSAPALLSVVLALAGAVAPIVACSQPARAQDPILTASVWRASILPAEPLLVRIAIENPSASAVRIVPPYLPSPESALGFEVRDETGALLPGPVTDADGLSPLTVYGSTWWGAFDVGDSPYHPARLAWTIPAGGTAFMWADLAQFFPFDKPGRYRVVLHYTPTPGQLTDPTGPPDAPSLWVGAREVDLGSIEVRKPAGEDADLAQYLIERREQDNWVLSSTGRPVVFGRAQALWEASPDSAYAPYARFHVLWLYALYEPPAWGAGTEFASATRAFAERYPDFPLNHQLPLIAAMRDGVVRWLGRQSGGRAEQPTEVYESFRSAARETGDAAMVALVERRIWMAEEGFRLSSGQAQK